MIFDIETPQLSPSNPPMDEAKVEQCCKNETIIACFSIAFLFASDLTNVPFSLDMKFRWCWHCSRRRRFWHFKFGQTWILRSRAGPESHRRRQSSHHNGKETGKQQTYERPPSWTDYFMTRHGLDSTKAIKRTWKRKNNIAVFRGSFCCFTRADNCILLLCDADVTRAGHKFSFSLHARWHLFLSHALVSLATSVLHRKQDDAAFESDNACYPRVSL